ncbi:MAG: DNA polymerase III subunit beta [Planctomycetota bacterium]|nr:MAG: DNA polymerase III subunit beta [Planctomycetota bacterium]
MKVSLTDLEETKGTIVMALEGAATRSAYPGFGNLFLTADKEKQILLLRTTDGEVQVEARCECSCEQEGKAVVRVESFKKVFQKAEFSTLEIEEADESLLLKTDFGKFRLRVYSDEEFPEEIEAKEDVTFSVLPLNLLDCIRKTQYAVSTERSRYALNGVYAKVKGNNSIELVATDGRRLAHTVCPVEESKGEMKEGVILPVRFVRFMERVCSMESETVELGLGSTASRVVWSKGTIIGRNLEGQFPDYEAVIPTDNEKVVVVSRTALIQGITEGALLSEREARAVVLDISKKTMRLSSQSYEGEEAEHYLTVDYDGSDIRIAFNPDYLIEPLKVCSSEYMRLCLRDKESAALLLAEDEPHFKYVLMPLTVD